MALSRPMRVLFPPASTKAVSGRSGFPHRFASCCPWQTFGSIKTANGSAIQKPEIGPQSISRSRREHSMVQKLLDALKIKVCSHQVAWHPSIADGQDYQVCLLCAAQFEHDVKAVHRTRRAAPPAVEAAIAPRRSRDHVRGASWIPRSPRLDLQSSARFRERGKLPWHPGGSKT